MEYSRMRWLGAIVPGTIAGIFETLRHTYFEKVLGGTLGNIVTFVLVAAVTYLILDRLFDAMEDVGRELARQQRRSALLEERDRIAREMHDGLSQSLFFLNTKLHTVERCLEQQDLEGARREIQDAKDATSQVYTRVRQTIYDLKTAAGDDWRLETALAEYVEDFEEETGIPVHLKLDIAPGGCQDASSVEEAFHLFRIVQEALFNVRRHAGASQVRVLLRLTPEGGCELEVEDDGRGFRVEEVMAASAGHFGIRMMQERARLIGAEFSVESSPGRGARIRVHRRGGAPASK